ncbi:palmitoyltransferase for Vac8p [Saxophila tyrrhenica]|uniref:Palmitoyltransferase n=1 Tax=Saxophila tyrrhenica TaxID=1690608 RepID=A0AAV9P494_9PEZI|nr:palmitoyltransferase for Vac8p [Saxophila tyrrhenica]
MATLGSPSPPSSPSLNFRRKSWARRLERCCCQTLAYFPLTFVYGLTTWAVYVEVNISFWSSASTTSYISAFLGLALYLLANTSYTVAVFTSPGSPLDPRQDWRDRGLFPKSSSTYSALPTSERHDDHSYAPHSSGTNGMTTLTAKSSTGKPRYCKKCHVTKPDRAHHCSTCGQCVLKMDHHCPWLATCVGLHNYKPFLLFLTYTSLFCWLCFAVSGWWVWNTIAEAQRMEEGMKIVNAILLAVLGGIIGLVLTGFTGWHIWLAVSGQTTIESLEKTRYLSPLRRSMEPSAAHGAGRHYIGQDPESREEEGQTLLDHLKETHANALPGILRPEEGEESRPPSSTPTPLPQASFTHTHTRAPSDSPAKNSLTQSYASLEAARERARYAAYQDELDSAKLPNAFDLGWKRNLLHVLGPQWFFWPLPVCNSTGDGWGWDVSQEWREAVEVVKREREAREREEAVWDGAGHGREEPRRDFRWQAGQGFVNHAPPPPGRYQDGGDELDDEGRQMQMQPLDRRKPLPPRVSSRNSGAGGGGEVDSYDTSSDEDVQQRRFEARGTNGTANWNDIPDDFLSAGRRSEGVNRSRSRGRRKGD